MKTILSLLTLGAAFFGSAAEPSTLTFTAPIASPQRVETGWKWYYARATNNWVQFTTNIVDGQPVITDNGAPPTFLAFCRTHIQNTFDAHGAQWFNGYMSEKAEREKARLVRTALDDLSVEQLNLLLRITYAVGTNTLAVSNALNGVVP